MAELGVDQARRPDTRWDKYVRDVSSASTPRHSAPALAIKRSLDLVAAVSLVVLALPLMLAIAIAVKATSRGPALFKQERVGRDGQVFILWKFRSMLAGTSEVVRADPELRRRYEENDFKLPPDLGFTTPVGRLIRKTSLDELPQLFNVIAGHMSMVGNRPLLVEELARRPEVDQMLYCSMRPGITGNWQVRGRSSLSPVERWTLDREYIENWSIAGDVSIVLRTPAALLRLTGTQ